MSSTARLEDSTIRSEKLLELMCCLWLVQVEEPLVIPPTTPAFLIKLGFAEKPSVT